MRPIYRTIKAFPLTIEPQLRLIGHGNTTDINRAGEYRRVIREGKEYEHEGSFEDSKVDRHPWRLILPASDRNLAPIS